MGQLEKYGLYVLVVVIVLILGVAIWGDGRTADPGALVAHAGRDDGAAARADGGADRERDAPLDLVPLPDPVEPAPTGGDGSLDLERLPTVPAEPDPAPVEGGGSSDRPAATVQTYVVQRGDNPTKIVKRFGGTDADVPAFMAANPGIDPKALAVAQVVNVPPFGVAARPTPGPVATPTRETPRAVPETYVVKSGDYPGGISYALYGTTRHWRKLLEHNGLTEADAKRLPQGTVLRVPKLPVSP